MLYSVYSGQWFSGLSYQRDHLFHTKTGLGLPRGTRPRKKKKCPCRSPIFMEQVFLIVCKASHISTLCPCFIGFELDLIN